MNLLGGYAIGNGRIEFDNESKRAGDDGSVMSETSEFQKSKLSKVQFQNEKLFRKSFQKVKKLDG